jgi:dTDP-4-dehydrorhamnose reductase
MLGRSTEWGDFNRDWSVIRVGGSRATGCEEAVDATDAEDLKGLLNAIQPDAVLNLTGLTSVDYCERNPRHAYRINAGIVENLVEWRRASHHDCYVLHLSTDHVYHGAGPHSEENAEPSNYYALTKYAGEIAARNINSAVIRTNFFGRSGLESRKSFSDWLYESLSNGKVLDVYSDVMFSPLSMSTLGNILSKILRIRPVGTYNLGSRSGLSKADFALHFAAGMGFDKSNLNVGCSPDPGSSGRAYRPKDMRMDVGRIEACLGESMPELVDEIQKVIAEYLV